MPPDASKQHFQKKVDSQAYYILDQVPVYREDGSEDYVKWRNGAASSKT